MVIDQLLNFALKKAKKLPLQKDTKYIFFSDLHKGNNSYADDFTQNMRIYKEALHHYYKNDFTYIELGDGIELWENRKIEPIIKAHRVIFDLLKDINCWLDTTGLEFVIDTKIFKIRGKHIT